MLQPALGRLLPEYPDIRVEVAVDYSLIDIVAEGFDAGVRLGEQVASDMIALRIGPDMRMAVVGAPAYFQDRRPPQTPQDLTNHSCINVRLPTYGGLFAWEFEKNGRELKVRVDGQLVFNTIGPRLDSALQGLGLAYMPEDLLAPYIATGDLIRVLSDWCPPFPGYHLYYPSRRHASPAFLSSWKPFGSKSIDARACRLDRNSAPEEPKGLDTKRRSSLVGASALPGDLGPTGRAAMRRQAAHTA